MYVPGWFFVLSVYLCIFAFLGLITLLSWWISRIVRFVHECRLTFNRINDHSERLYEIEKQLKRCSRR